MAPSVWSHSVFSPGLVAGVAMVVGSTCAAPVVLRELLSPLGPAGDAWAVAASTATLTALLACFVVRADSRARVAAWCFLGAPVLGALNAGLTLALLALAEFELAQAAFALAVGTTFGAVVGGPVGLLFGASLYVPAEFRRRAHEGRSLAATEYTAVASGLWLLVVGGGLTFGGGAAWALPPLALGALLVLVGAAQLHRRWRVVARLRAGVVPGFRVVPREPDDAAVPMLRLEATRCRWAVVRQVDASPYRDDRAPAIALV